MNRAWRPNLTDIPERPGVYLFRDAAGAILYIGKALNLRRRIGSYFQRRRGQPRRLRRMMTRARAVLIHETGSELEALLLESRLLKQETPPFNQLSTAYAALPFVKLTLPESFPRLVLTREFAPDGGHYLGPFPRFDIAAVVLAALQRLFALRTCEPSILPGVSPQPCEAFQLRKCAGPCVGPQEASTYRRHVDELLALLAHGHGAILQRLREERQRAADAMFFERARHLHRLQAALDEATVGRPLALLPVALRNILVSFERSLPPSREIFCIRRGLLAGRLTFGGGPHDRPALEAFLTRCMAAEELASSGGEAVVDELRIVAGWLQRTHARARWIFFDPQMHPTAILDAVMRTLASRGDAACASRSPLSRLPSPPALAGALRVGVDGGDGIMDDWIMCRGPLREEKRCDDRGAEHQRDHTEREADRHFVEVSEQHFGAHEDQDHCEAQPQVVKRMDDARQQEVEGPKPEDGEHVRGVDDERVLGDGEDGRNRVHREDQVGRLHQHQHHEERRRQAARPAARRHLPHEEVLPVVNVSHGHDVPEQPDHRVGLRLDSRLVAHRHPDAGEDQKGTEDVENPVELLDQVRPGANHGAPHRQRAQDPPEQHPVLQAWGDPEVTEEEGENEDIVDRERLLDEIARQELQGGVAPHEGDNPAVEGQRQEHPEHAPGRGLLESDLVRLAVEHQEVEGEHRQHKEVKADPEPEVRHHPAYHPASSGAFNLKSG
jgi:hypothetical protein